MIVEYQSFCYIWEFQVFSSSLPCSGSIYYLTHSDNSSFACLFLFLSSGWSALQSWANCSSADLRVFCLSCTVFCLLLNWMVIVNRDIDFQLLVIRYYVWYIVLCLSLNWRVIVSNDNTFQLLFIRYYVWYIVSCLLHNRIMLIVNRNNLFPLLSIMLDVICYVHFSTEW